jgi:hypothetical protein
MGLSRKFVMSAALSGMGLGGLGFAAPAFAQDGEWEVKYDAVVVTSAVDSGDALAPAADGLMASGLITIEREDTFDNGFTLGWRFAGRYERDAPSRPAFAGALGGCPATNPACPGIGGLSPISPATGIAAGGATLDEEGFATLEAAAVSLLTPWGEGVLGVDAGGWRVGWMRGRRTCCGECRCCRPGLIRRGFRWCGRGMT